jgi:hypothetical protein
MPSADAGGGWLIFALPPAELAVHPADGATRHELFLMCDDIPVFLFASIYGQVALAERPPRRVTVARSVTRQETATALQDKLGDR